MRTSILRNLASTATLVSLLSACGAPGGGSSSICTEAAQYVSDCQGGDVGYAGDCDNAQAAASETLMTQSCDQIAAGAGKTDGGDALCIALVIPMFVTGLKPGDLCCFGYQCKGSANTCIANHCGPRRGAGEKCGDDNNACLSPLTCLPSKKCGAPLADGAACKEKDDCAAGLSCNPNGKCAAALPDGDACTRDDQCQQRCIAGTCAPRSEAGGACESVDDCTGGSACVNRLCVTVAAGSSCNGNADCFGLGARFVCADHICKPPGESGGACDPSAGLSACRTGGETCFRGTCEPRHEIGEACDRMLDCRNAFCRDNICSN